VRTRMATLGYDRSDVGRALREQRLGRQLTQAEVAWTVGITQAALSNYENGKRDIPIPTLISICRAIGTYPAYVIPGLIAPAAAGEGTD